MSDPKMIQALGGPAGSVDALRQQRSQMYDQRKIQLADLYAQARQPAQAPQQPRPSPIAMRRQELVAQGMHPRDALMQMAKEGLIPANVAQKILGVAGAGE